MLCDLWTSPRPGSRRSPALPWPARRALYSCPQQVATAAPGGGVSNIPYGFPGRIGLTFQPSKAFFAPCDLMPFIQTSVRLRRAFAILMALASLATGPALAEGFKFGQPDESDRIEKEAREDRIADQLSTPCRAGI